MSIVRIATVEASLPNDNCDEDFYLLFMLVHAPLHLVPCSRTWSFEQSKFLLCPRDLMNLPADCTVSR